MAWYKTGTLSVTQGATSVTGLNTRFASNSRVGDGLRGPDGEWYEVVNIASETVLGIYPAYKGVTVSGSSEWTIAPLQGYNKETADRLRAITDVISDLDDEIAAAQASATAAKASEDAAKLSETSTYQARDAALISAQNAAGSNATALLSKNAAKASEDAAKVSETNANNSKLAAATSATNANNSAIAAANSASEAANKQPLSSNLTTLSTIVPGTTGKAVLAAETPAAAKTTLLLNNVDNTSDAAKPISTAQGAAIADLQAQVTRLGGGTFIKGFTLSYNGSTSILVNSGSAWVPSVGLISQTNTVINTGVVLSAQAIHYVYLYSNNGIGAFEISLTTPSVYDGTAYHKSGDASRRLIGSYQTSSSNVLPFLMTSTDFLFAVSSVTPPLQVISGGGATSSTAVSLTTSTPTHATSLILNMVYSGAVDGAVLAVSPYPIPTTSDALFALVAVSNTVTVSQIFLPIKPNRSLYYLVTGGNCFLRVSGYKFER